MDLDKSLEDKYFNNSNETLEEIAVKHDLSFNDLLKEVYKFRKKFNITNRNYPAGRTGEKYIIQKSNGDYMFKKQGFPTKSFKTLQKAIKYRDKILKIK